MQKKNVTLQENSKTKGNKSGSKKQIQTVNAYTNRQYKDRLFKFIFKEKDKLLSLYNALNSTYYTNPDDIEITTLEDVIYCKMKNDVSFLIDDRLSLFEHQSTFNPNMPLRGFLYFGKHFEKYISENELDIYGKTLIHLPTPKFVVFYNGKDMKEDKVILRLSDAFSDLKEEACMELEAVVLNINYGKNKELMESCHPLLEYSTLVDKVKRYSEQMDRDHAIDKAVEECIQEGILKDILIKHRAEVRDMLLTEYDEEKRIRIMENQIQIERQRVEEYKNQLEQEQQEKQKFRNQLKKEQQEKQELEKIIQELKNKLVEGNRD